MNALATTLRVAPVPEPSPQLRDAAVAASADPRAPSANVEALWRAIVEGRFRLVETFEQGGLRYYVLYENLEGGAADTGLTPRERRLAEAVGRGESEKGVAFSIGVTPSGASAILRSAMAKLGIRSKMDLVLLVGALCALNRQEPAGSVATAADSLRTSTPQAT